MRRHFLCGVIRVVRRNYVKGNKESVTIHFAEGLLQFFGGRGTRRQSNEGVTEPRRMPAGHSKNANMG